ncbi:MAG: hypothetical protein H6R05_160 [Burkholderiaceae bacterium]|nr:hypothetical protein [Burkholderiaceae bacterium]
MNDQTHSSIPQKSKDGNSALNIGIGMLLGLIVALVVAYFAMSSGPFRDKANKNVLSDQQGNTDPNAPLYTNSTSSPTIPSNVAPSNEQGAGVGALTNTGAMGSTAETSGVTSAAVGSNNNNDNNANENTSMTAAQTQTTTQPKKAPNNDAIAELITNKTNKVPTSVPNTANKTQTPVSAPNSSGTAPKVVTPVTANNKDTK